MTSIQSVGEFGLIGRIREILRADEPAPALVVDLGDDGAAYLPKGGTAVVVSTDALVEGVHFDLTFTPLEHLGYKALAVNVSDLAAMNALPRAATVTLALPAKITVEMVEAFYRGVARAAKAFGITVVGGDTTASSGNLFVSVTVLGEAKPKTVVRRSGAKVGDVVAVSGTLGAAYAGLKVLLREKARFIRERDDFQPALADFSRLVGRHLLPEPRLDVTHALRSLKIQPTAMIDISDGLTSEAHHIAKASGVGIELDEALIPLDTDARDLATEVGEDPLEYALDGGEEYQLLLTIKPADWAKLDAAAADLTQIGTVVPAADGVTLRELEGTRRPLRAAGFDHFAQPAT